MGSFDGKVVIVTGGAYGIGRATALEFAKEGAAVAIADINEEVGREVEADLKRLGAGGLLVKAIWSTWTSVAGSSPKRWTPSALWTSSSTTSASSRPPPT